MIFHFSLVFNLDKFTKTIAMVNDQIVDVPSVILVQDVHAYLSLIKVIK